LHNIVIEYHHPFFVPQLAYFAGSYVRFRDKDIQSVRKLPLENQDAKVKLLVEQMKSDAQQENVKRVKAKYATGSAAPATSADH